MQRLPKVKAWKNLNAERSRNEYERARQRDRLEERRPREMTFRDYSGSSEESDFSGRKRRVAGTTDKGRKNAQRTGRASPVSSFARDSDSDSEVDARERRKRRGNEEGDSMRAGKLIRSWGMKFSGSESRSAAEEFFEQLNDCRAEG